MIRTFTLLFSLAIGLFTPFSPAFSAIRVGTVAFDPPYVISSSQGFEMDLIHLLCQRMNQTCNLIVMDYYQLFTALKEGRIDVALDGIDFYVPPNPLNEGYIFSYPYLLSEGQFLVTKQSGIKTLSDLPKGTVVGLLQEREIVDAGIYYSYFTKHYGDRFKIAMYRTPTTLISALHDGIIKAAFLDNNEAGYWMLNGGGAFFALDKPMKVGDGIGIMALPNNAALIQAFDVQLKTIENSKAYLNLYNTYMGMGE